MRREIYLGRHITHIYVLLLWSSIVTAVAAHTKMRIQFNWANFFFAFFVFLIQKNLFIFDSLLLSRDLTMKLLSMAKFLLLLFIYFFSSQFIRVHGIRNKRVHGSFINCVIINCGHFKKYIKIYWHNLCMNLAKVSKKATAGNVCWWFTKIIIPSWNRESRMLKRNYQSRRRSIGNRAKFSWKKKLFTFTIDTVVLDTKNKTFRRWIFGTWRIIDPIIVIVFLRGRCNW